MQEPVPMRAVPFALTRMDAVPLLLALGIIGYASMEEEPSWWLLMALPVWGGLALLHRHQPPMRDGALAMLVMILGLAVSLWQTQRVDSPRIPERYKPWEVVGQVVSVSPDRGKAKLLVAVERITALKAEDTPRYVRFSVRGKAPLPRSGDRIRFRGVLYAPSPPVIPGGFDFARYFYYREIGAIGYALPPLEVIGLAPQQGTYSAFSRQRTALQQWLLTHIGQPAAGIAIALVTGDQTAVDKRTAEAFRVSSLTHILSISGMHMSIVCGMVFFMLRSIGALVPPLALRVNVKKWAAVMALLCGAAYLLLADFPTPAVRAYVMVGFFFCAVLLDREALSIRSLVWAAVAILAVQPSALLEPSFQLSFSATLALVVAYRRMASRLPQEFRQSRGPLRRMALYAGGIVLSSLVASAATAPFVAYHFNQFVPYGVLANLLALPLLSFLVMPALLLALALWPVGLSGIALEAAEAGIQYLIKVAQWVQSIPGATWYIPPLEPEALLAVAVGMLLMMLANRRWRLAGGGMVALALATAWAFVPPDILVSDDGRQLAVKLPHDGWVLVRGKSNRNFVAQQWQQRLGVRMQTYRQWSVENPGAQALRCTQENCTFGALSFPLRGRVLVRWKDGEVRWPDLDRKGAHALWLEEGGGVSRVVTGCDTGGSRPWKGCALE